MWTAVTVRSLITQSLTVESAIKRNITDKRRVLIMMGKRPTKKQAMFTKEHRLNYDNWLVCKDTPNEMVIQHKYSGKERVLRKG